MTKPIAEQPWFWPVVAPVVVGSLILLVWEFLCRQFEIPNYLFPAPSAVAPRR